MNILEAIKQQRNDIKTWTKNNLISLDDKIKQIPTEVYVGDGDMPETATIQILMDGSDEEQALKDELKEYIDGELELAKEDIIVQVYDLIKNNGVIGFVDENNTIIFSGKLTADSYIVKYKMEDGSTVDIGELVLDTNVYYSVTKNLTNCTINNRETSVVAGESYSAIITANDGYEISSVNVTMGGAPVSISGGTINIASVTGDIVITAVAEKQSDNLIPKATNADGALYVGDNGEKGYNTGHSVNSNGVEVVTSGMCCTGFIPVTFADKIYIKGITMHTGASANSLAFYDSSKTKIYHTPFATSGYGWAKYENGVFCISLNQISNTLQTSAFFRLSCGSITDETIITVNKPIS